MAEMPDLDTNEAGFTAYYNILDNNPDVGTMDADSALDYGSLQSYTLYDNGWTGTAASEIESDWNIRLKNDGWLVLWLDRRSQGFGTHQSDKSGFFGRGAIAKWHDRTSPTNNKIADHINGITSALDSSADIFYNGGDESWWDYEFTNATEMGVYGDKGGQVQHEFDVTGGATIHRMVVCADGGDYGSTDWPTYYDGSNIASNQYEYAYLDETDLDTSVTHTFEPGGRYTDHQDAGFGQIIVLYS